MKIVAVIGASNKPERYSFKAISALKSAGYDVCPVHPALKEVLGLPVFRSISELRKPVDTVSLYVNADRSSRMAQEIIAAKPRRIIFNPGAENDDLKRQAEKEGIGTQNACTLVMLSIGAF